VTDNLKGDAGNDHLNGGLGNDIENGGIGNDTVSGGGGNDVLNGGAGTDVLTGGTGLDIFQLASTVGFDKITDFNAKDDTIQLDNGVFTSLVNGVLAAGILNAGAGVTTAADANDYLIYNTTTGALYYDADANGAGAAVEIAILGVGTALTSADLTVI
jgi:Ca2+-binding RTX toxin-like protein